MGQNAVAAEKPKAVQALRIRMPESRVGISVLPIALGAMRLDVTAVIMAELGKTLKRSVRAAWNEARRHHRPDEVVGVAVSDVLDERLCAGERGVGGGVAVAVRAGLRI